jgi:RNA 3'-terminal phosphate cyclase (ATP)
VRPPGHGATLARLFDAGQRSIGVRYAFGGRAGGGPEIDVDGAQRSGSGTIVRFAVALAALLKQPVHIRNARARRPKPGLRPQHLAAVRACAELCGATTQGVAVDSREFSFQPGPQIRGGHFDWDIGTAGSTTMLALGVLPLACFAVAPVTARIAGGVFQDFAPSPHHMQHVLAPLLGRMGVEMQLSVVRAGYVPRGSGVIDLRVRPLLGPLEPLTLEEQGVVQRTRGIAFASHLKDRRVAERMARTCEAELRSGGLACPIERQDDELALHAGASLAVWAETSSGGRLGADRAGARRRSSEAIGRFVARQLLEDLRAGAAVDRHVADQLVLFAALARGTTRYRAPRLTEHLRTNLWLAQSFGATTRLEGSHVQIDGLGLRGPGHRST